MDLSFPNFDGTHNNIVQAHLCPASTIHNLTIHNFASISTLLDYHHLLIMGNTSRKTPEGGIKKTGQQARRRRRGGDERRDNENEG